MDFSGKKEEEVVIKIKNSAAQLLFVAITSPKKENFINKWKKALNVNFVMGVWWNQFDIVCLAKLKERRHYGCKTLD